MFNILKLLYLFNFFLYLLIAHSLYFLYLLYICTFLSLGFHSTFFYCHSEISLSISNWISLHPLSNFSPTFSLHFLIQIFLPFSFSLYFLTLFSFNFLSTFSLHLSQHSHSTFFLYFLFTFINFLT